MKQSDNYLYLKYLMHENAGPFTIETLKPVIDEVCPGITSDEIREVIEMDRDILKNKDGRYVSRWWILRNKPFSILPTANELKAGVLVIGSRFVPFSNHELLSNSVELIYKGVSLPKKIIEMDTSSALELFCLYGYEYAMQHIAADQANEDEKGMALNFDSYSKVKLTGFDISGFIKESGFKKGDRIVCNINNWINNIFDIYPVIRSDDNGLVLKEEDLIRSKWFDDLECALLESFQKYGPCSSIQEQLSNVFTDNMDKLFIPECGSVYELIKNSKKIGLESFGVETRLWNKNEEIPAVGNWNSVNVSEDAAEAYYSGAYAFGSSPMTIVSAYILNCIHDKKDVSLEQIKEILPVFSFNNNKAEKQLSLKIKDITVILKQSYNLFSDFKKAPLRKRAIELYKKIADLIRQMDESSTDVEKLPQQELVILTQLMMHSCNFLELLSGNEQYEEDEYCTMSLSLDGMEYSFEDISPVIIASIEKQKKDGFEII